METANTPHHVDIGGRLGFIYGSLSAVALVFGWFFIPETRRMEIEDIDERYALDGKFGDVEELRKEERMVVKEAHN